MDYDIDEHRHRFALWAASRAAQRGLSGGAVMALSTAIDCSSLPGTVRSDRSAWPSSATEFDDSHRHWCSEICARFLEDTANFLSYGRAAKLVAIYLKATVV